MIFCYFTGACEGRIRPRVSRARGARLPLLPRGSDAGVPAVVAAAPPEEVALRLFVRAHRGRRGGVAEHESLVRRLGVRSPRPRGISRRAAVRVAVLGEVRPALGQQRTHLQRRLALRPRQDGVAEHVRVLRAVPDEY